MSEETELNIVEKLQQFFSSLTYGELMEAYDVLCLLRGPDSHNDIVKKQFTGKLRYLLFKKNIGFINNFPFVLTKGRFNKDSLKRFKNLSIRESHYRSHCLYMFRVLSKYGLTTFSEDAIKRFSSDLR